MLNKGNKIWEETMKIKICEFGGYTGCPTKHDSW